MAWQIKAISNSHGSMKDVSYISSDAVGADWKIQARWNQFSDFSAISRSHNPKPWSGNVDVKGFVNKIRITGRDKATTEQIQKNDTKIPQLTAEKSIRKHRKLRYRLLPYIYSYAHINYRTGMPICRPMLLAFPGDHRVNGDQWPYQYMFGQSLLVAPVYGDFSTMEIYLPPGHQWIDYWTKEIYNGGGILRYDVSDINKLPLFVKSGSILAMGKDAQWINPSSHQGISFEIYPGEKASTFTLFEDDGITTDYRKGKYSQMTIGCKTVGKTLHIKISAMSGHFHGKPGERAYCVKIFNVKKKPGEVKLDRIAIPQSNIIIAEAANIGWHYNASKNLLPWPVAGFGHDCVKTKTISMF